MLYPFQSSDTPTLLPVLGRIRPVSTNFLIVDQSSVHEVLRSYILLKVNSLSCNVTLTQFSINKVVPVLFSLNTLVVNFRYFGVSQYT